MAGICFSIAFSPCESQISHLLSARSPIINPIPMSWSQHFLTFRNLQISSALSNFEFPLKLINANPCKRPWGLHEFRSRKVTQVDCTRQQIEGLNEEGWSHRILQIGGILSAGFPLWVALACFAGLTRPQAFLWIRGKWQIAGLTLTMLGMGMTLSLKDLQGALAMPKELLGGVVLQYTVMPFSGALIMTPMLTAKLAGQYVAVDAGGLLASTLQVVLLPVVTGAIMNQYIRTIASRLSPFTPLVAVVTVSALCASAIAQNSSAILSSGGQVVVAVGALHSAGFFFGFLISKLLGFNNSTSRTVSIEVGMQNSVLGVVLAGQHFSNPLTAVPCAVSSVCQSIFGSALAGYWRLSSDSGF